MIASLLELIRDHFDTLMRVAQVAGFLLLSLPLGLAVAQVLEAT